MLAGRRPLVSKPTGYAKQSSKQIITAKGVGEGIVWEIPWGKVRAGLPEITGWTSLSPVRHYPLPSICPFASVYLSFQDHFQDSMGEGALDGRIYEFFPRGTNVRKFLRLASFPSVSSPFCFSIFNMLTSSFVFSCLRITSCIIYNT